MHPAIITDALAYAATLDSALIAGPDDLLMDALIDRVGELLGGLSTGGFAEDLRAALTDCDELIRDDNPAWGGSDVSCEWLDRQIEDEQCCLAQTWLRDAQAIMAMLPAMQVAA